MNFMLATVVRRLRFAGQLAYAGKAAMNFVFAPGGRQLRFLGHAERLEEGVPPGFARLCIMIVMLLLGGLIGWSAVTPVSELAVTTGQIVPAQSVISVQHLEGGIIAEVLVEEGAMVEAGQPIARLAETASLSEHDQMRVREAALAMKSERLLAFVEDREPRFELIVPDRADLAAEQRAILDRQTASRTAQREVFKRRLAEREGEVATSTEQIVHLRRQIALLAEEAEMRKVLLDKGLASRIVWLETERNLSRARSELSQATGALARAREQGAEIQQQIAEMEARLANDAMAELGQVAAELAQVREVLRKSGDKLERVSIVAPVRGRIKGIRGKSVGMVVPPGGAVADLVPSEGSLIAEVRIEPRDIGAVQPGLPANVKIGAFDFTRYGGVNGTVSQISPTTFEDESGGPYYKALIALERPYVGDVPAMNKMVPGMTVRADIKTGERTVLEYIAKPVKTTLAGAMRER
jgi:adhesin transport system membrane fusion protein